MELRLEKRYEQLVQSHLHSAHQLAAGIKTLLNKDVAFNQTQAAWRFLNNERCTLEELSKPLLKAAHEPSKQECDTYVLIPHDWSHLSYNGHQKSKKDIYNTFKKCRGYDLQSSLLISDLHGGPLALGAMNIKTKDETFSSYNPTLSNNLTHLEELSKRIDWLESQNFTKQLVHIVDREGDSVAFLRSLKDRNWLIRSKENHKAHDGVSHKKLKEIAKTLSFTQAREIQYKGFPATQQIAETQISIIRPARPTHKNSEGKRVSPIKGNPVKTRLVISRIVDNTGKELAMWYLLTNLSATPSATIALWYYWRWSIESYFKLIKSAGMQIESWQQTTGIAVARRLLISSMACVCVWRISHATGEKAGELRQMLVRLSGRQMKWKKEFTCNALFAGLSSLLSLIELLEHYDIDEIKSIIPSVYGDNGLM